MKKVFNVLFLLSVALTVNAQSYDGGRVALANFLVRMYSNAPFEGVRAVDDYNNSYLISVLSLDKSKYKNDSELNRVASVKAMAQASRYLNGSIITQDMIIRTTEKSNGKRNFEIIENIHEHSMGYVNTLEQLTNFTRQDGQQVFIFIKQLDKPKGRKRK